MVLRLTGTNGTEAARGVGLNVGTGILRGTGTVRSAEDDSI
jgi:hypothetical protein